MTYNRVFNGEEQQRIKQLITEGCKVKLEVETLNGGLRETVKAIAEEMDIKPSVLTKAIAVAHKANWGEEQDKHEELEAILDAAGFRGL